MDVEASPAAAAQREGATEYMMQSGTSLYAEKRQRRDTGWTVAYCLLAALTVFWAIPAFTHTDPNAGAYTYDFYLSSTSCDVQQFQAAHPPADEEYQVDQTFARRFKTGISIWLPITALLSTACAALYLWLFRRWSKPMVFATIVASVCNGILFSIICLATGAVGFGIFLLIATLISALFYYWIRAQLHMCAELLSIAGRGLNENLGLLPAAIGIKVAGLCVLIYATAGFFSAVTIGSVSANPYVQSRQVNTTQPESAVCLDASSVQVPCCQFNTAGWAAAYAFFAAVFISWSALLIMQIKLYTVADTVAQWYFSASAPSSSSSAAVGSAARNTRGSVRLALRNCLTNSFGTVAFAAAVLALLRVLRRSLERAARNNIICCILNCILQPLLALAEQFTKFSTIAAAITGQAFVPAAKSVFETLKRNFLNTYGVWWVPEMVLHIAVMVLAFSWGGLVFFITLAANKGFEDKALLAFSVAVVATLCILFVLNFIAGLLLDVVNTLYICWCFDKDRRVVTHPEIDAIYMQVPGLQGSAVQNPDGTVMYGNPEPPAAPQPQPTYASPYASQPYTAPYGHTQGQVQPGGYNYVQTNPGV